VCAGGSTTWDVLAQSNAATWPAELEANLRARGRAVEVWNAGFPGWTSLENLIAFESRDLELGPDLVVLYQGINDLQPAAHEPADPSYADFHAALQRASIGVDIPPLPWWDRLVLVERARDALFGPRRLEIGGAPGASGPLRRTLTADGVRVFERNVRSLIGVAHAHGVRVLLATQPLRRRAAHWDRDVEVFQFWVPDLEPDAVFGEMERLNDVLRRLAADGQAALADVARDVAWTDGDFLDPMHTNGPGSQKLATFLAAPVERALAGD
jgi:lysophospholipase L1-like esterase